ncbi:MAG: hypothetical protein ACQERS_14725 [Bacteroidota bacterium]
MSKKEYIRPKLKRIDLDNSISIIMMTPPDNPGKPPWASKNNNEDPFESPFEDKPFN